MPEVFNDAFARISQASTLEIFAVVAGLLQVLGYIFYIRMSVKNDKKPNPATWIMFAYGTGILAYLEFDLEINPFFLALPIFCAVLSIVVVIYIFWKFEFKKMVWKPDSWMAYAAVAIDISLTIAYVHMKFESESAISGHEKHILTLWFLALSNASTIVSFMPMVKDVIVDHEAEHPLPWFVWGSAYTTLAVVTIFENGFQSEFLVYPAMNLVLHFSIGILASRQWFRSPKPLTHL
jgi:hypothetical protein